MPPQPLPAADVLIGIAQIAVSLAGFSGLIAALRGAMVEWHPRDIWSMSWMLGMSVGALLLGLLPPWLALSGAPEAEVYRLSGAVAVMYLGLFGLATAIAGRRLTLRGFPPRVPGFPTVLFSLLAIAAIADLAAAFRLFGQRPAFAYVGSLVVMLLAAVAALCVFLVLLARKTKRE
jgi:hypothetical protein